MPADFDLDYLRESTANIHMDKINEVYRERNALVVALLSELYFQGYIVSKVPAPDAVGMTILYAELPQGQVSWHIPDNELGPFTKLPTNEDTVWDGHTTSEKYRRLERYAIDNI